MKTAQIAVTYLDHMGDDTRIADAARVSFDKWGAGTLGGNEKLIKYLADNNHWSPFAHCFLTIRVKAPIFLARQLVKHQVGLAWNEVSRRYVDYEPEFYSPSDLHNRPDKAKQGSGNVISDNRVLEYLSSKTDDAFEGYNTLLSLGVCPEEARMVLPLNTMTEWIWSGSLMAFLRVIQQRSDSHAQLAAQDFARELQGVVSKLWPISSKVWLG